MKKLLLLTIAVVMSMSAFSQTKYVVLEEHTGMWCQWCPRGLVTSHNLAKKYPENFIPIEIHSNDPVANQAYLKAAGLTSAPSGHINRASRGGDTEDWIVATESEVVKEVLATLDVSTSYEASSREITVNLTANFNQSGSGYKLTAVLLEDGITGPAPEYNQSNAYGTGNNGKMAGFETLSTSVSGEMLVYNHVARKLLGQYNGDNGSLPSTVQANTDYKYQYTYTLPEEWDETQIYAVGMIVATNGVIENAGKSAFIDGSTNSRPNFSSTPRTRAYSTIPYTYNVFGSDADDAEVTISGKTLPSWLTVGENTDLGFIYTKAVLSGTPTAPGDYDVVLEITDGNSTTEQAFTITVKEEPDNNWVLSGRAAFSKENAKVHDIKISASNTVYALVGSDNIVEVYSKKPGADWTSLNLIGIGGTEGRLAFDSKGRLYVAYATESGTVVNRKNGSEWDLMGSYAAEGVQIGLEIDKEDRPIICMQNVGNNSVGSAFRLENEEWKLMGGKQYSRREGVWNESAMDSEGNFHVLWNDYSDGNKSYVSKFNGTGWERLGKAPIDETAIYFYQSIAIGKNGDVYVAAVVGLEDRVLNVYKFDGNTWENIGSNIAEGSVVGQLDLELNKSGDPCVAFVDESSSKVISCMWLNGGNWEYVGYPSFTVDDCGYPELAFNDNIPYVAYSDAASGSAATVRTYGEDPTFVNDPVVLEASIYPNPANGTVTITAPENTLLKLISLNGKTIHASSGMSQTHVFDVSHLPKGIHLVELTGASEKYRGKLIIE